MEALFLALLTLVLFIVAYHTYGRWLGLRIFELSVQRVCPSVELGDGKDYVKTPLVVVFGHHFTSIAGTGPIVGPAIGVIWGWVPALLWVVFGSIFIGAVHDLGSLVISLRNKGRSIGDLAGEIVGPRVRLLFMCVLVVALTIVLAVFGLVVAAVFRQFPAAIFPCLAQIPLAVLMGLFLRRGGNGLLPLSVAALTVMYLSVWLGDAGWLHGLNEYLASLPIWVWTAFLLGYCYVASVLPVWLLLQPRDFINALQLLSVLGLLTLGLVVSALLGGNGSETPGLRIIAPAFQWSPEGAPLLFPFLFITIACGAVSGFHCLVSSGTSSKQLASENHARPVGFGAMLTEGFLATLTILACVAGLGMGLKLADGTFLVGEAAWAHQYRNWGQAQGLSATVGAFVNGGGNFLAALGISTHFATALMGVFVASFAATTMDTTCRLQRYILQELGRSWSKKTGESRRQTGSHLAAIVAVVSAAVLAAIPASGEAWTLANAGKGGMMLWPIFGATNQMVAGIAFIVIIFWVRAAGKPVWFLFLPMLFMLIMPLCAIVIQTFIGSAETPSWMGSRNWPLVTLGVTAIVLEAWLVIEALFAWQRAGRFSAP